MELTTTPNRQARHHKIDLSKALTLRFKGLSYADIAKHFNVTPTAAYQKLHGYLSNLPELKDIENDNTFEKFWKSLSWKMAVESMKPSKIQKASTRDLMTSAAIAFDKYRLEAGKSTENIASIHAAIEAVSKKDKLELTEPNVTTIKSVDDDL